MITEEQIIQNLKKCSRFERCSANICPLDWEIKERTYILGEEICPFTIKKRGKSQKGVKTQAPAHVLEVVPKFNLKMLSRANQKRWWGLHQRSVENKVNKSQLS